VKEGYIVGFCIKCNKSLCSVERKFTIGPRRRLLEEILLWIKMLFVEKGFVHGAK